MWNRKESPHARIPVSHPLCTPPPHSPPPLRPRLFILGRVHSCVGCSHRTPPPRPRDPMILRSRGGSRCTARTSDRWTHVELHRSRSSGPDGTLVEHPSSQARRPTQPTACAGRPSRRRAEVCCASAAPTRGARLWVRSPVCAGARKRAVQVCRAVRHTALSAEAT